MPGVLDDLRAPVEAAGIRYFSFTGNAQQMAGWGPSFSLQPMTLLLAPQSVCSFTTAADLGPLLNRELNEERE